MHLAAWFSRRFDIPLCLPSSLHRRAEASQRSGPDSGREGVQEGAREGHDRARRQQGNGRTVPQQTTRSVRVILIWFHKVVLCDPKTAVYQLVEFALSNLVISRLCPVADVMSEREGLYSARNTSISNIIELARQV